MSILADILIGGAAGFFVFMILCCLKVGGDADCNQNAK